MAKKKKEVVDISSPSIAAESAFDEVDGLDCINMLQGGRIENALSTGTLSLDLITGGGYMPGVFGTIFGPEGSGKSTLLNAHIVSAQSNGIPVIFYDSECGADPVYMSTMGVDFKSQLKVTVDGKAKNVPGFFYSQPDTGEAVYRHILRVLRRLPVIEEGSPTQLLMLIDSLEGMASEEVDEVGDGGRIADEARMHSYYLKRVVPRLRRRGVTLIATNQMRTNIGAYGAPQQEAGGKALQFWPGIKIRTSRKRAEEDKIGVQTLPVVWRTTKNRAFPSFRSTDMRLMLGRGIDKSYDAFYFLKQLGYLEVKAGKSIILLDGYEKKGRTLPWKEFRREVENPKFQAQCRELLQDDQTYRRYFQYSDEATYNYDSDYAFDDEAGVNE